MSFPGIHRLLAAAIVAVFIAATAGHSLAAGLAADSPFLSYLNDPPWIERMHFKQSQLVEISTKAGYIDKKEWVTESYEAAIQPTGFYLERFLSRQLISQENRYIPARRSVMGISDKYYWTAYWGGDVDFAERSLILDPRSPQEGGSDHNDSRHLLESYQGQLANLRYFGFPELRKNSLTLAGGDQFTANTVEEGPINGKILALDGDRPQVLEYEKGDGTKVTVHYRYTPGSTLPNSFDVSEINDQRRTSQVRTNWIDQVRYGTDLAASTGYSPSAFFKDLGKFNHVEVWSNGISYTLGPKGEVVANGGNQIRVLASLPGVSLSRPQQGRLTMGLIIFAASVIAGAIIWAGKIKKQPTN